MSSEIFIALPRPGGGKVPHVSAAPAAREKNLVFSTGMGV